MCCLIRARTCMLLSSTFTDPWKIDILEFLESNYMNDISMEEIANYTGRSLSTFKRDFKKCSTLSPREWLIHRRLEAARELIRKGGRKVSDICFEGCRIQTFPTSRRFIKKRTAFLRQEEYTTGNQSRIGCGTFLLWTFQQSILNHTTKPLRHYPPTFASENEIKKE